MAYIDFITQQHTSTKRDYVGRVMAHDKAACATVATQWGRDYWDGERQFGYGGYSYDGRWRVVAEAMVAHYDLKPGDRILDVGCGKAFLLYEFTQVVPGIEVVGIDISQYGVENAKEEVRNNLKISSATGLPFEDGYFDYVYSINTLHNLKINDLFQSLAEINRVKRSDKSHITIEGYRTEEEKVNLLYWQLTCESFYRPEEWKWIFERTGYKGDYGCIFFE
jgi:protein-L-isoaspartate(D-aspartate) O-methyltransferase